MIPQGFDPDGAAGGGSREWSQISGAWTRQYFAELDRAWPVAADCEHDYRPAPGKDGRIYQQCSKCGSTTGPGTKPDLTRKPTPRTPKKSRWW